MAERLVTPRPIAVTDVRSYDGSRGGRQICWSHLRAIQAMIDRGGRPNRSADDC